MANYNVSELITITKLTKTKKNWFIYILKCSQNTFYTGITTNIQRRIKEHDVGKGAKYTKGRAPFELVYQEECLNRSAASKREYQIKNLSLDDKHKLINKRGSSSLKITLLTNE